MLASTMVHFSQEATNPERLSPSMGTYKEKVEQKSDIETIKHRACLCRIADVF